MIDQGKELDLLVKQSMGGDSAALTELCSRIAKGVLFRASAILNNKMDAEDAAQEALIRVCKNIGGLKSPGAFKVWLNTIVINETRRIMERYPMTDKMLDIADYQDTIFEEDPSYLPADYSDSVEDSKAVIASIKKLPTRQREAIFLHYYDGLSVQDTADAMQVSIQSASQYIMIARGKIKTELERLMSGEAATVPGGVAAVSAGAFFAGSLGTAEQAFQVDPTWYSASMKACANAVPAQGSAAAHTGASASAKSAIAIAVVVVIGAGIFMLQSKSGSGDAGMAQTAPVSQQAVQPQNTPQIGEAISPPDVDVVFTGPDSAHPHIDPTGARVDTASADITVMSWTITGPGGGAPLYQGSGDDASQALRDLEMNPLAGEYSLNYRLKDGDGVTYTLSRTFYIN